MSKSILLGHGQFDCFGWASKEAINAVASLCVMKMNVSPRLPWYCHFTIQFNSALFNVVITGYISFDRTKHITKAMGSKILSCGVVRQGISRRVLRGATYDPGH
jgi:hypothetical protein